jgi:hypothetical protein
MEANGIKHPLTRSPSQPNPGILFQTTDSSYIQVQYTNSSSPVVATYKSGIRVLYQGSPGPLEYRPYQIEDTNGNIIQIFYQNSTNLLLNAVTDTVGRTIHFYYDSTQTMLSCVTAAANCSTPIVPTFTFQWNPAYILNFAFVRNTGTTLKSGVTQLNVLTGVTRPDGTRVSFSYGDWAIVNQVQELSTTGAVRYSTSLNFPTAASAGAVYLNPTYTQQTIYDGINTATWQFQATASNDTGLVSSMAITDPAGATTTTTFSANGDWEDGLPTQEQITTPGGFHTQQLCVPTPCPVPPSTPVVWRTVTKNWTSDPTTSNNPRLSSVVTVLDDGSQSETLFNTYDANGNLTDLLEYDFGSSGHGPLLREVVTSFPPLANNILDRPADIKVKDASGTTVYHKTLRYDEGTIPSITPAPAGRDFSFSQTVRGNLTSSTVYANPANDTNPVSSTFTYDYFGNQLTSQVGCCSFTQKSFSTATQYAYPDSVSTGPQGSQLTTKFSYNLNTGTVKDSTDLNSLVTQYTYDIDNRVKTTATPDGITLTNQYDDAAQLATVTSSSTANSAVSKKVLDGRGRTVTMQALNGSSVVSTRSLAFDGMGHLAQASNPYGPGETPLYTTFSYDVLGRPLTKTPPSINAGGTQQPYKTDYFGTAITFTDPKGRQRRQYKNALGNLTRVDEPGDPFAGTASQGSLPVFTSAVSGPRLRRSISIGRSPWKSPVAESLFLHDE